MFIDDISAWGSPVWIVLRLCSKKNMPELTITSPYIDSKTFTMDIPMPESTLTLCQSRLYPPARNQEFGLWSLFKATEPRDLVQDLNHEESLHSRVLKQRDILWICKKPRVFVPIKNKNPTESATPSNHAVDWYWVKHDVNFA
jgi:hypothetical protein